MTTKKKPAKRGRKKKIIFPTTKGGMIKALKEKGIRQGEKEGRLVKLEHLKTVDIINLFIANY